MTALLIVACMCAGPRTIEDGMQTSDAVFTATILSKRVILERQVSGYEAGIVATAHVDRVWKGDPARLVRITTGIGGGDCGIHLDRGKTYRVFAHGSDDTYGTSACDMTGRENTAPRVSPNSAWAQRFLNLWSALVIAFRWRWLILPAMGIALFAAIFIRERIVVPLVAWLISWGVLAYDLSWLELSWTSWALLGGIVAAVVYLAVRGLPLRKLRPVVPAMMPALMLILEWPQWMDQFYDKSSVAGFLLGMWSSPAASQALTFAIPFLLLTLLWIATLSRRWFLSIPAAVVLASIAIRAAGPWPGLLMALQ